MSHAVAYSPARWEEHWREKSQQTWGGGRAHPALVELLESSSEAGRELEIPLKGTALVPGCGMGYELHLLAGRGLDSTGLELAPTAVLRAQEWLDAQPPPASSSASGSARVIKQDYFSYTPEGMQTYDLILDPQFLCAIPPNLREDWAEGLFYLSHRPSENGKPSRQATVLITLMCPLSNPKGLPEPPFTLSADEYHRLLDSHWECVKSWEVPKEQVQNGRGSREMIAVWRRR